MRIGHVENGEAVKIDIRGNGREGRMLLVGDEDSPDNYRLNFSRQTGDAYSPRHRHNFDQIRMVLGGGTANYGPKKEISPGEIVYFPEGTHYGPQDGNSRRFGITLQFGGPSGFGFISRKRMAQGMEELKVYGSFEKGIFTRTGELVGGERRNQDAYEAIWEHVNGRRMTYPKQRYEEPVHMRPVNFEWRPVDGQPGVSLRKLGCFSEREVNVSMIKIDAGASATIAPRGGRQLGLIVTGAGQLEGQELKEHSAFELLRDEGGRVTAAVETELLLVGLPLFSVEEVRAYRERRTALLAAE